MRFRCTLVACIVAMAVAGCQPPPPPLTREERLAQERANLMKPFKDPHPFEPAGQGYKVVFPGKPKPPQFREIMHDGSVWSYDERRLGKIEFTVVRTALRKFLEDKGPRQHIDYALLYVHEESLLKLRSIPDQTRMTHRYFKFKDKYEAVDVVIDYVISHDDDSFSGARTRRRWIIITDTDQFDVQADGRREVVNSHLADSFFMSFELVAR